MSQRDKIREAWKKGEGINVLVAVGPATCQGIDLSVGDSVIEEIYLDSSMDSRLEHQISSRTIGPHQKRSVKRVHLEARTSGKRNLTIDNGVKKLLAAKRFFSDLVCSKPVPVTPEFLKAIENNVSFLGDFCSTEDAAEEVSTNTRGDIDDTLKD